MYSILTAFLLFSHEVNKRTDAAISELKKYVEFLKRSILLKSPLTIYHSHQVIES